MIELPQEGLDRKPVQNYSIAVAWKDVKFSSEW